MRASLGVDVGAYAVRVSMPATVRRMRGTAPQNSFAKALDGGAGYRYSGIKMSNRAATEFRAHDVTAAPMAGPIPFEAAYIRKGKRGKTLTASRHHDRLCSIRCNRGAVEYRVTSGIGFAVTESMDDMLILLAWDARINGAAPIRVWHCADTGRYQCGY